MNNRKVLNAIAPDTYDELIEAETCFNESAFLATALAVAKNAEGETALGLCLGAIRAENAACLARAPRR